MRKWDDWSVILVPKMIDPIYLFQPIPWERGQYTYRSPGHVVMDKSERQVPGSISRYNHPHYKEVFYEVKNRVQEVINEILYPTYYYDRFYFKNQELTPHKDRPSCEVSVSLHCSNNLDYQWPIWFDTPDGDKVPLVTNPGDAVIYKGCEREHWREPMKGNHKSYYHQIFFHYVRRDGPFIEHAFDAPNRR